MTSAGLLHRRVREQLLHASPMPGQRRRTARLPGTPATWLKDRQRGRTVLPVTQLVGTFAVLMAENIAADAPLHDRLVSRYRAAVADHRRPVRIGQSEGATEQT